MDVSAKVTSKGQVTLPKAVRDALGLKTGDRVLFRVGDDSAVLARTSDFLELAGSVEVPPGKRGASWEEIRSRTRRAWAEARR
jgi:antitoxin PrlF